MYYSKILRLIMSLQNINDLKEHIADVFFETGTYEGWLTRLASEFGFKKIITIEIIPELFEISKSLSTEYKNIDFYLGSSPEIMKKILPQFSHENITFWLDAHPSGYFNEKTWPVFEELSAIKNYCSRNNHTILIDDIRLFKPEDIEKTKSLVLEINPNYNITFLEGGSTQDVMVCKII